MTMKNLLLFSLFAPFVLFGANIGDGECHIETLPDGSWTIRCSGDGVTFETVYQTNQVFVVEDCENLKSNLLSSARYIEREATRCQQEASRTISGMNDFDITPIYPEGSDLWDSIVTHANDTWMYAGHVAQEASRLEDSLTAMECGTCSEGGGGGGSCCDFTAILNRMAQAQDQRDIMIESLRGCVGALSIITNQINYLNFLQEHGWHDTTNYLSDIYARFVIQREDEEDLVNDPSWPYFFQKADGSRVANMGPYYVYSPATVASALEAINWTLGEEITSLNNYHYNFQERLFPYVTNYFSFFRGEIGVHGVLEDWTSEQSDGTYHDFLTNHYLSVVRGGSLSGNQSSKTNWFSRIETLLAALVFTDTTETNTVDTSAGQEERSQLSSSYDSANQAASSLSDEFKNTSQSIVSLYQGYFSTFENAAMPSHIVLMKLTSNDSEDIEIAFQSDSLGILVESCRVVTTLCWSSVGIFLLYKFLVWSARCVVVACQFIYRAISSVFKS